MGIQISREASELAAVMPTTAKALLYLANNLLFWAKTLLVRAKIIKACGLELLNDHISELPEEIIVHIVSMLTMKEAGRTSVLSKSWRYVWTHNPILKFDGSDTLDKLIPSYEELMEVEKPRYLSWVNQVVGSYRDPTIDAFVVRFDLSMTDRCDIDNWIKFAMEKRVKRLDLNFEPVISGTEHTCYTISGLSICSSLTFLRLSYIDISSEVLQNILISCPSLESLLVVRSNSLEALEVSAVTLKLKKILLFYCAAMKNIDIYSPNLKMFKYGGPKISFPFKRFPKLTTLSLYGEMGEYLLNNFSEFSSYLLQLEELTLHFDLSVKQVMKSVTEFPQCKKLEVLSVAVEPYFDEDLSCFTTLIKACPNLQKFEMELCWQGPVCDRECKEVETEACPHGNLKMVEIEGFVGHAIDLDFIMHLIKNCVVLEKIIVHICPPSDFMDVCESEIDAPIKKARMQAEKLRAKLKHGIELVIIDF